MLTGKSGQPNHLLKAELSMLYQEEKKITLVVQLEFVL